MFSTQAFRCAVVFVCFALLSLSAHNSHAQVRLDFLQGSSSISARSYSEVQSPVSTPPCPPLETINDQQGQYVTNLMTGRITGGAYTRIKRGVPNCKISAQGNAFVIIDGDGTNDVMIRWWCHSNTQYNCYDPDCAWTGLDTAELDAAVGLLITGVPDGTPVEVTYYWEHFSSIASRSEAATEDYAEIQNASLDLFGQVGFGNGMNLSGNIKFAQRHTGDTTITFNAAAGDSLLMDVTALTTANIDPPARPVNNPNEDDAFADFYGYVIISVNAPGTPVTHVPPSCPQGTLVYSPDIGSDVEYSDPTPNGNEILDPGDLYPAYTGVATPFFDDLESFPFDPWPTAGNPAGTCIAGPQQQHQSVLNFDLDGADRIEFDLYNIMGSYGPGMPSLAPFTSNCIYSPDHMLMSYDEDRGIHYNSAVNCNVPSSFAIPDSVMLKGAVNNDDEVLMASLFNQPLSVRYQGSAYPYHDEQDLSPLLAPAPMNLYPPNLNDDVDALDIMEDPTLCNFQYYSVDHEAHFMMGADTMRPGYIYQAMGDSAKAVVRPAFHLGLPDETDIDAFEFAWLYDSVQQRRGLALVFSVSVNDPFDATDYTGGLDPGILYGSFLNGSYFEVAPSLIPGNLDAVTFYCGPFRASGAVYTPPTYTSGIREHELNGAWVRVHPNPTSGHITIEADLLLIPYSLLLTDITGREVKKLDKITDTKYQLPLKDLEAGVYLYQITGDKGERVSGKVVVR